MAHNKKKLIDESLSAIQKYKLFFIEDVIAYISCCKATFYKYKLTQDDIDRGRSRGGSNIVGIATTTATTTIVGTATTFTYEENSNYLQVPPNVIGVNKIFTFDGANTITPTGISLLLNC